MAQAPAGKQAKEVFWPMGKCLAGAMTIQKETRPRDATGQGVTGERLG